MAILLATLLPFAAHAKPPMPPQSCLVVGIADGDTLTARECRKLSITMSQELKP